MLIKHYLQALLIGGLLLSASCKEKQPSAKPESNAEQAVSDKSNPVAQAQPVAKRPMPEKIWMSLEDALNAQKTDPRPIMIDVYTSWCGPCKMLDQNTFNDPRVKQFLFENYYAVKFNAEAADSVRYAGNLFTNPDYVPNQPGRNGVHQFARYLNVNSYPTLFFMDKTGQPIGPLVGYRTPAQIELYLHYFKDEKYQTIKTQEEFQQYEQSFQVTWN